MAMATALYNVVMKGKQNTIHMHFKDLCVARCIHTLESGNCTSRGDWDGCHLSMISGNH